MIPTAVIVTRGDVDLTPVLDSLPVEWPVVVWDNSKRDQDLKVYGHFAALEEVQTEYVYMQDDDALCPADELLAAWDQAEHGEQVFLNAPEGDTPWISWGAIFQTDLPSAAIDRYVAAYGMDDDVLLWCDLIFALLTPWTAVNFGATHLPWARAANRMCVMDSHYPEQARIRELVGALQ